MEIKIKYDGAYPNLCGGNLVVTIDDKEYQFPNYCLSSGGAVWFDDNWSAHVDSGEWSISEWPKGFPEDLKWAVEDAVNAQVEHGCCGGCI